MSKMLLIHSYDNTTDFLEGIMHYLKNNGCNAFEYIKIDQPTMDPGQVTHLIASQAQGTTIIFLGHGSSHGIYLPLIANSRPSALMDESSFHLFSGKNLVCLSCRSADFIMKNFGSTPGSAMIGFDELPTHWEDVYAEREVDHKAYRGMTNEILSNYRDMLAQTFSHALYDAITHHLDFNQFYLRLRLYINRQIFRVANYTVSSKPTILANMLFELKQGIRLFGNENIPILPS
jgi:hypothetical protein